MKQKVKIKKHRHVSPDLDESKNQINSINDWKQYLERKKYPYLRDLNISKFKENGYYVAYIDKSRGINLHDFTKLDNKIYTYEGKQYRKVYLSLKDFDNELILEANEEEENLTSNIQTDSITKEMNIKVKTFQIQAINQAISKFNALLSTSTNKESIKNSIKNLNTSKQNLNKEIAELRMEINKNKSSYDNIK